MSRSRAKRPVRNPFVVTLAAATAILTPGCGARVDAVSSGDGGTDTQPIGCPASEPNEGVSCSADVTCNYGNCYGMPTATASCRNGEWSVMRASCNPPPPDMCPPNAPPAGSRCYSEGKWCEYFDRCVPSGMVSLTCRGGSWQGAALPTTVACPTTPPVHGSSCADCAGRYPSSCVYEWCGTYPSREAICDPVTKTWNSRWSSCNPPPPDVDGGTWFETGSGFETDPEPDPAP